MVRHRKGNPLEEESSSDEEDAFSAMSKKKKDSGTSSAKQSSSKSDDKKKDPAAQLPASTTSSNKRHHLTNDDSRKAKMDALLQELEAEKSRRPISVHDRNRGFVPQKTGSFVDPGEEHLTTNIFVGNLAPSITEEQLTDIMSQFGDLYSVKIMWPRTPEERARNRNTGFVCFMNREDAEEAMQSCDESDPFNVGRRIMMRWGKNVKKIIKRGTGGLAIAPIRKRAAVASDAENHAASKRLRTDSTGSAMTTDASVHSSSEKANSNVATLSYDPQVHGKHAIHVEVPQPPSRAHYISLTASFVAKDGDLLEKKLVELQVSNPAFDFLAMPSIAEKEMHLTGETQRRVKEHIYYRWRVYAFCQGDGFNVWKTEPFQMITPNGKYWIPPALNKEAAWQEEQERKQREEAIEEQKKQRRRRVMTGRQLEKTRGAYSVGNAADGGAQLTPEELEQFNLLVRKKLCASRESICEAMAFCFEKSGACKEIASRLKEALIEHESTCPGISVETRIARLYLLSDVLFNSQQPGVRNAFKYRDAIERMAPEVFESLGKHGEGVIGRMRRNKLSSAVSSVLAAWTNWSVYNPVFLDELHARFEGREITMDTKDDENKDQRQEEPAEEAEDVNVNAVQVITEEQRRSWTDVSQDQEEQEGEKGYGAKSPPSRSQPRSPPSEGRVSSSADDNIDGEAVEDDDVEGEALGGDDVDGEALDDDDVDGEALDEDDVDGEALDDDDLDGQALADEDIDGEALA